jgi:hypothetical protein
MVGANRIRTDDFHDVNSTTSIPIGTSIFLYDRVQHGILETAAKLFHVSFQATPDLPFWDAAVSRGTFSTEARRMSSM